MTDSLTTTASCKPPLKWAGGKRWLVPTLKKIWEQYAGSKTRLVEPFCGGLSVALGLEPQQALLNDINPHCINFYRQLQSGLTIKLPLENSQDCYYQYRERFNTLIRDKKAESPEAAGLFYYLNRTGFNGLCRFNKSGEFNVPFGQHDTINYQKDFLHYQPKLSNWQFSLGNFNKIRLRKTDLIYADPPYDVPFTQYAKEPFGWEQQVALVDWLAKHSGPVILSNQATPRIVKLYKAHQFKLQYLQAPRFISCKGDRKPAKEVLAIKGL